MISEPLPASQSTTSRFNLPSIPGFPATVIVPAIYRGSLRQMHLIKRATDQAWHSFQIDLQGFEQKLAADFSAIRSDLGINDSLFPYRMSAPQWWRYALAPHSYLQLNDGQYQVGLNSFNRFLHLDLRQPSTRLVDPGVGDEFLSCTNWFDADHGELWFASWPVEQTVRRMCDARADVAVSIWKSRLNGRNPELVWHGTLGDSLHQLAVCPARRYLILTELGLYPEEPEQDRASRQQVANGGIVSSRILVLDLQTGQEWYLPMMTAGHVEFDPVDPRVCYVSGHNIGLIGPRVTIFGPGIIQKFRLTPQGPQLLGTFSRSDFYRITTHALFRHRHKTLIAVTGYPATIFLIDADSMTLFKTIEMSATDHVDLSVAPHPCRMDSYGIAASPDGETLLIGCTGVFRRADITTGRIVDEQTIDRGSDVCFTGHLGSTPAAIEENSCGPR